ncbi:MAG TPA: extracellular solute-binding protein [Anaerolineales bacterium]|nr:extracellular solute-binding protein [Anaerolineales bacterium]
MSAKVLRVFSIVLAASMLLAACQQAAPTQAPGAPTEAEVTVAPEATEAPTQAPAENRVLKVWHYESDTGAMGKAWLAAKEEFEATHPGVTVEMDNTKGFEEIRQTASMVLNSDEAPDVMEYNKGNATAGLLSQQGLLADLTDEVAKRGWDKIIVGGLQTTSRYENGVMGSGQWYGVTNYGEFVMVYYNKKLFEEHGVEVPTTLEEFEAVMDKFVAAGLVPIATGASEYPAQQIFYELVLSKADQDLIDSYQLYKSPVDFHNEAFTFGAEKMAEWVEKGYIEKNSTSMGAEDMGLGFESGKYPMMISGSWWYGRLMTEITDFDWGIFLFPGNQYNPGSGGNLWVVAENSENKDLAYDWIDITLSPKIQTIMGNEGGLPVNANAEEITDPKVQELVQAFKEFSPGAAFYPDWPAPGLYDALVSEVQELINGTKTPSEMLDSIDTFYNENKPQ